MPFRLLLAQPPVQDFYDTGVRLQPLGLCCLKAAVQTNLPDVKVAVVDYHAGCGRRTITAPPELAGSSCYFSVPDRSPFCAFSGYFHYGASFEKIAEDVAALEPDLVGISSLFSPYYREVLATAKAIKAVRAVPIVIGGAHASACPELMLNRDCIDYVIIGEGERPLVELVRALIAGAALHSVPNLGFKEKGQIVFTERKENYTLDELPLPDMSDLDSARYKIGGKALRFVMTSRGCPYACTFCSVHAVFGAACRRRSLEQIHRELELHVAAGARAIDFEDDNLSLDRAWFSALCRMLKAEFPGIRFSAMNGLLYHTLDAALLAEMKAAGFADLNISLVTAGLALSRSLRRPLDLDRFAAVVEAANALDFQTVAYQIIGLPGDTLESMIETMTLIARLPVLLGASIFYLAPGSPLAEEFGPLSPEQIFCARSTAISVLPGAGFDRADLYTLFICARIINFLKELADNPNAGSTRTLLGKDLIGRLLDEHRLFASTPQGLVPLPGFRYAVFEQLWRGIFPLAGCSGNALSAEDFSRFRL